MPKGPSDRRVVRLQQRKTAAEVMLKQLRADIGELDSEGAEIMVRELTNRLAGILVEEEGLDAKLRYVRQQRRIAEVAMTLLGEKLSRPRVE